MSGVSEDFEDLKRALRMDSKPGGNQDFGGDGFLDDENEQKEEEKQAEDSQENENNKAVVMNSENDSEPKKDNEQNEGEFILGGLKSEGKSPRPETNPKHQGKDKGERYLESEESKKKTKLQKADDKNCCCCFVF